MSFPRVIWDGFVVHEHEDADRARVVMCDEDFIVCEEGDFDAMGQPSWRACEDNVREHRILVEALTSLATTKPNPAPAPAGGAEGWRMSFTQARVAP